MIYKRIIPCHPLPTFYSSKSISLQNITIIQDICSYFTPRVLQLPTSTPTSTCTDNQISSISIIYESNNYPCDTACAPIISNIRNHDTFAEP